MMGQFAPAGRRAIVAALCLGTLPIALGCAEMAQTALVLSEAVLRERRASESAERARNSARLVQIVARRAARDAAGRAAVAVQLRNGARFDLTEVRLRVRYLNGTAVVARDDRCAARLYLRPGQSGSLLCTLYPVRGASSYRIDVQSARFR